MKFLFKILVCIFIFMSHVFAKDPKCQISYLAVDTIDNKPVDFKEIAEQLNKKGYELDLANSSVKMEDRVEQRKWFMNTELLYKNQGILMEFNDERSLSDNVFKQFKSYIRHSILMVKNGPEKRSLYLDENKELFNVFIKVKPDYQTSINLSGHQSQYKKEDLVQVENHIPTIFSLPTCGQFYRNKN